MTTTRGGASLGTGGEGFIPGGVISHIVIMIVDDSSVIMKNVFTKVFELCEWRKLIFCNSKTVLTVLITIDAHFKIYMLKQ